MSKQKRTSAQIAERILYILAVMLTPSIPLFFLYGRNAAQGLLFRHFLIFGGALAVISLTVYFLVSKFLLRRRRTMILLVLFWSAFWFYSALEGIVLHVNAELSQTAVIACLLALIAIIGFVLRWVSVNRSVANVIAFVMCILFVFNFAPEVLAVLGGELQRARNANTGILPYEIKTGFYIDPGLPSPNVYWLHMDGMMGFSAVDRYFGDSQTELKNELIVHGFVINENARLEAGRTFTALPALVSPTFYDSYFGEEFRRVANLVSGPREISLGTSMAENGFTLDDVHPYNELIRAFSEAGYTTISNLMDVLQPINLDIRIQQMNIVTDDLASRETRVSFSKLYDFKNLIMDASVLTVNRTVIDKLVEVRRPEGATTQPIPDYLDAVSQYMTGYSHADLRMAIAVRAMKHASTFNSPYFFYFVDWMAHYNDVEGYEIGGITYDEYIGQAFTYDENGNIYNERLDDPHDVQLYLPQHRFAAKLMITMIETIIENDPSAVIIIQADHGIHGIGPGPDKFDSEFMFERGYSLEDQIYMNMSTISAVRIPHQYGTLTRPLDPLDIARYLVNNFVGAGNYEYLFYREDD